MKLIRLIFRRMFFLALMVILEIGLLVGLCLWFGSRIAWFERVLQILGLILVLFIIKRSRHLSMDVIWILLILLLPVPGTILYLFLAADLFISRTYQELIRSAAYSRQFFGKEEGVLEELEALNPDMKGQFRYLENAEHYPFYRNTGFDYYPLGDEGYPILLEDLKKAEKFIFMEYFIIEEGVMWDGILAILEEKAKKGIDVRVMYDDIGSFFTLSYKYARELEARGIKCVPFNRINPIIGAILNHRDHRKITVIDGKVAFSGGVNLADEYINVKVKYGHWKDNMIRITGKAVWSYTVLFLSHWNALHPEDTDYTKFKCDDPLPGVRDGFICPYGETPLDKEITSQTVYEEILYQSSDYCYIMTPYLIIDTELENALILAAKQEVDVRIITPGIPDKKLIWQITKSYYRQLIEGGVKIYEYTPGFVHSKVFVSDDKAAAVGTINLDYRSLYLHFENGTYLYGSEKVLDVKKDFLETLNQCHEVTLEESKNGLVSELFMALLRVAAPML